MEIENITALRGDISGGEKAAVTQLRIERLEALGTRHSPASPPASLILPIVLSASLPPPVSSLLDTPLYHFHLASCSLLIRATISIYALQKANRWKDYMSPFLQNWIMYLLKSSNFSETFFLPWAMIFKCKSSSSTRAICYICISLFVCHLKVQIVN